MENNDGCLHTIALMMTLLCCIFCAIMSIFAVGFSGGAHALLQKQEERYEAEEQRRIQSTPEEESDDAEEEPEENTEETNVA